jgi:uncharacterized protein
MLLDIYSLGPEGLSFEEDVQLRVVDDGARQAVTIAFAQMRATARPTSRGARLSGRLQGTVQLGCSRCLEPFEWPLEVEFGLLLVPDAVEFGARTEQVIDEDDATLYYTTQGKVDTREIATEQVYLNLPLKPVCGQHCRGLCLRCGANRNLTPCDCGAESPDQRLAALLKFKLEWRDG